MIHISGFEEFGLEQTPNAALARADYTPSGQLSVVAGRYATAIATRGGSVSRIMQWKADRFSVGFAHQFDARGSVAWLKIGDATVVLWMNPDTGMPTLNDKIGGALPTINRWYYIELEIERAGGVSLYINNRFDARYDLAAMPNANVVEVGLGYVAPATYRPGLALVPSDNATKTYDDFYIRDGARIGPIVVTTRFPSTDKKVEWFKSDEKMSHAEAMSLHPPKPLDNYVASATVGAEDRFTSTQPLPSENTVVATGVFVLARKSPTLDAKVGVFIGGSAAARSDKRAVGTDWRLQYVCFEQDNTDTPTKIAASEFGFNVAAS